MFRGVYTALVTPFLENGSVDRDTLKELVHLQIRHGVQGLVPMGTTGESPTLNHEEHIEIIRLVTEYCQGKLPVIAGTGSNSTAEAVDLTRRAKEVGVAATLQVAPYYNKPTQEGLYSHYRTIAEEVDLPLIIYNIPGRCGVNIENSTMLKLARLDNVRGVKDATGNISQLMDLLARKPDDFDVLSGDDNISLILIALGGNGVISVASNLIPDRMVDFIETALNGSIQQARTKHYELLPLFGGLSLETNPIPIKAAMAARGMLKEVYRLPICRISASHRDKLLSILKELKIIS